MKKLALPVARWISGLVPSLVVCAALSITVSGCGGPKGPLQVPLHYGPTSTLEVAGIGGSLTSTAFVVGEVRDARDAPESEIGENLEDDVPVKIMAAPDSVIKTVQDAIMDNLRNAGLRVEGAGDVQLDFDIVRLWVEETNIYEGVARLRVTVTRGGQSSVVIVEGTAKRFGSSLSEENYTEVVSDSLLHAVENLITLPEFEKAVSGVAAGATELTASPEQ